MTQQKSFLLCSKAGLNLFQTPKLRPKTFRQNDDPEIDLKLSKVKYKDKLQFKMKAKLEAIKEGNTNAYSHMVEVIKQMILNNDQNGYHLFECYSQNVKNNT